MSAQLVQFPTPEYRDPAKCLRNIADSIEAGEYGEVNTVVIAVVADTMEVFGGGADSDGPTCALVFAAAAHRFAREVEQIGQ